MNAHDYRNLVLKGNKFHAKKAMVDGIKFDSQREAARYSELKIMERAGLIRDLELQPQFFLAVGERPVLIRSTRYKNGRQAKYSADFAYWDVERGRRVVEDVKSPATRTEAYVIRKAVVEAMYPDLQINEV
jgi:hypothetical protein